MYDKRIKIFVILSSCLLLVCLLRLSQMQLLPDSSLQDDIAELKRQRGLSRQFKTIRGRILDRKGKVLAADEPQFQLCINYRLSCFLDERLRRAKLLRAAEKPNSNLTLAEVRKELETRLEDLQQIVDKCTYFGLERADIEGRIKNINDRIWNLRTFLAWRRNGIEQGILQKYNNKITNIPLSVAIADFEKKFPDGDQRLLLVSKVDDITDMDKSWPVLELETDDDVFAAQLEFLDVDGIGILAKAHRFYPYDSVAAQMIGWVSPQQSYNKELFADDELAGYSEDELSGQRPGVEYVCEAVLRGKRGKIDYDIDHKLISRTETQHGQNVSLALDIELQQRIENYLANYRHDPNCGPGMAVVVIDVATADILALVSMPTFDLNRVRYDYADIERDPNEPLRNRAVYKQYPPGSSVKPIILIAGLESGKVTADEIIGCPVQKAPKGWPSCWIYNRYPWRSHDDQWPNNARNAIKGSCNIYFSRLANRIEPLVLQQWMFKFGYGHKISFSCPRSHDPNGLQVTAHWSRDLRQAQGQISDMPTKSTILHFEQVPPLKSAERRWFGIGQGNLRATPLQVANSFATIARDGLYKSPRLFRDAGFSLENRESGIENRASSIALNISPATLDIVRDSMNAVVDEPGGTAYNEFAHAGFAEQDVMVYGKTGSTERPDNAWFAGFVEDSADRSIAIAVVVEGGQHGSSDAAPLARDIIQFCIEADYIGR